MNGHLPELPSYQPAILRPRIILTERGECVIKANRSESFFSGNVCDRQKALVAKAASESQASQQVTKGKEGRHLPPLHLSKTYFILFFARGAFSHQVDRKGTGKRRRVECELKLYRHLQIRKVPRLFYEEGRERQ